MPTSPHGSKLLRAHDVAPERLPVPSDPPPAKPVHRGLSLRPEHAIDPYAHHRFVPEPIGAAQLATWCPGCNTSLLITDMRMTERGLFIEGVCYHCGGGTVPGGGRPGIYKRCLLPLPWGRLPPVEED